MDRYNSTMPEERTRYYWAVLDFNRNGKIGRNEVTRFIEIVESTNQNLEESMTKPIVVMLIFDTNKDQRVSPEEVYTFFKVNWEIEITQDQMQNFFAQFDTNSSGYVEMQEI